MKNRKKHLDELEKIIRNSTTYTWDEPDGDEYEIIDPIQAAENVLNYFESLLKRKKNGKTKKQKQ